MLGLRRSSVTLVAQTLQSRRLIKYRRKRVEIVNRRGLKAAACECYEVISRTFDQIWRISRSRDRCRRASSFEELKKQFDGQNVVPLPQVAVLDR